MTPELELSATHMCTRGIKKTNAKPHVNNAQTWRLLHSQASNTDDYCTLRKIS